MKPCNPDSILLVRPLVRLDGWFPAFVSSGDAGSVSREKGVVKKHSFDLVIDLSHLASFALCASVPTLPTVRSADMYCPAKIRGYLPLPTSRRVRYAVGVSVTYRIHFYLR